MNHVIAIFGSALTLTVAATGSAAAAPNAQPARAAAPIRVASFGVANMMCSTCPITVKKAMSAVHGVRSVSIDFENKTVTVQFDPKLTSAAAIAAASTNAGYPARQRG